MNQALLGNVIVRLGEQIKSGSFALTNEEMIEVMKLVAHEKWYIARICKELNCTQRTLERWVADGLMPPLRKEYGGKKFYYSYDVECYRHALNR